MNLCFNCIFYVFFLENIFYETCRSPDKECVPLREFLQYKGVKFSTVDIRGDSLRLAAHGIEIPVDIWIDIQDRINFNGRGNRTSMGDLAAAIIDPSYSTMKEDFPSESHKDWELQPLPEVNLNYAATDGYVSYELYKRLKKIMDGQHDRPPREVLCPNCHKAAWKASLPPGWDDDNKFVGTDYWGWVAHCRAHNIKFDANELPPGVMPPAHDAYNPGEAGTSSGVKRMKRDDDQ